MAVDISQYKLVSRQDLTKPRALRGIIGSATISFTAQAPKTLHLSPAASRLIHFNEICEEVTAMDLSHQGYCTLEGRPFIFRGKRKACACLISKHSNKENNLLITTMPLSSVTEEEKDQIFIALASKGDYGVDIHCAGLIKLRKGERKVTSPLQLIVRNQGKSCVLATNFTPHGHTKPAVVTTEEPLYENLPPPER